MAKAELNFRKIGSGGLSEFIPSSDITVSGNSFSATWDRSATSVLVGANLGGVWHSLIFGVGNTTDFWVCYGASWSKLTFSGTSYSGSITDKSINITTNTTVSSGSIIIVPLASEYPTSM